MNTQYYSIKSMCASNHCMSNQDYHALKPRKTVLFSLALQYLKSKPSQKGVKTISHSLCYQKHIAKKCMSIKLNLHKVANTKMYMQHPKRNHSWLLWA